MFYCINELIFFLHVFVVLGLTLGSCALGKEALIACVCTQGILSNLLVTKQMTLFGLDVICTDVFAVGGIIGLNLLQEYFGRDSVKKAISINFFILIFYLVMTQFHLWYLPNTFDTMQEHFSILLTPMLRITVASFSVYVLVQLLDSSLYRFLHQRFAGNYLVIRNILSLACSQFIDTVLFSFAALYGIVTAVGQVIAVSFTIKMLVIALSVPFIALSKPLFTSKK
jgi:uncharacterized integral membrane protein (TIGR00697 family)